MSLFARKSKLSGRGRATILEADGATFQKTSLQGRDATGVPVRSKLRLRVVPDDGLPEFESSFAVWGGDQGHFDALQEFGPVDGHKRRNTVPISVSREWTRQTSPTSRRPQQ